MYLSCIHLDSLWSSPYRHCSAKVGKKVAEFLNGLWNVMQSDTSIDSPFSRLKSITPAVTMQEGMTECALYLIMFMSAIITTRNLPYMEHDFLDNMRTRITRNSLFKSINTTTVDNLRIQMKVEFLFLEEESKKKTYKFYPVPVGLCKPEKKKPQPVYSGTELGHELGSRPLVTKQAKKKKKRTRKAKPRKTDKKNDDTAKMGVQEAINKTLVKDSGELKSHLKIDTVDALVKDTGDSKTGVQEAINKTLVKDSGELTVDALVKDTGDSVTSDANLRLQAERKQKERQGKFYFNELRKRGLLPKEQRKTLTYLDRAKYPRVSWKKGVQMSLAASSIPVYGTRGNVNIFGIIVRREREQPDEGIYSVYELVDDNLIKRSLEVRCNGGSYSYTQLTGYIMPVGTGSVPVALVKWEKESPKWVTRTTSLETNSVRSRKKITDEVEPMKSIVAKIASRTKNFCSEKIADRIYFDNFVTDGQLKASDKKVQHHLNNADIGKAMAEAQKLSGRHRRDDTGEIIGKVDKRTANKYKSLSNDHVRNESMKLSLLYEIISGKRACPGIISGNKTAYLKVTQDKNPMCGKRKQEMSTEIEYPNKRLNARKVCKHQGCSTPAHKTCDGYCSRHKVDQKKCTKCHKRRAEYAGGICKRCYKLKYPDPESLRQARMCIDCRVKESRRIGGRCSDCATNKHRNCFWNKHLY